MNLIRNDLELAGLCATRDERRRDTLVHLRACDQAVLERGCRSVGIRAGRIEAAEKKVVEAAVTDGCVIR